MPSPLPAPQPLTIPDVTALDQASVRNNQAILAAIVQEMNPDVSMKQGTIYNLLLYLSAVLTTCNQAVARQVTQSNSLLALNANPALATDTVVDNLLSNYNITRNQGAPASGPVQVVLNAPVVVTISKGAVFTVGTQAYVSDAAYTSRVSQSAVLATTDKLITTLSTGLYGFNINVVAQAAGVAGNIPAGTNIVPAVSPSSNFVSAVTLTDFSNGVDTETNAQLTTRLASGVGLKAWSNRMTVDAVLRNQTAFASIIGTSVIGYGDTEMVRDQHSLWPGSMGGRADLYVRTQGQVGTVVLNKTATLVAVTAQGGVWQFSLGRDEAPGFYETNKITQAGQNAVAAGYTVQSDVRGYDLTNLTTVPDIVSASEAQFSRYATGTIQFLDPDTPTGGLTLNTSTRQYDVSVRYMPLVAQIQDFITQRSVAAPGGDVVVKAPVPIFMTVSLTINITPNTTAPVVANVQAAVALAVNQLSFGGKLTTGVVSAAVAALLPAHAWLSQVGMTGRIRNADNTTTQLSSSDVIVPPVDPTKPTTSNRTVAYFLSTTDVVVSVVTTTAPQV